MTQRTVPLLPLLGVALAIAVMSPARKATADPLVPDDDASFVSQMSLDVAAGSIVSLMPNFKNMGAANHAADYNAYTTNVAAGSIDATPANASAELAQGAVSHAAD